MQTSFDLIVVGGGIVGAATAFQFRKQHPTAKILVLEKEGRPAAHQTGRNSGVIHSGLYYKPGSLKATTCLSGYAQLLDFCAEYRVAHEVCGKIVVATDPQEADRLAILVERGKQNGLEGLTYLDPQQTKEIEPHIEAYQSLWVPQTGIVDYVGMTETMLRVATDGQGSFRAKNLVLKMYRKGGTRFVETKEAIYQAPKVVVCAGLQSDRMAHQDGVDNGIRIVPFRGD